jgi:hypothetical protein
MHVRRYAAVFALTIAAVSALVTCERPAAGALTSNPPFTPPRTPWGDPDIQGDFANDHERGVPMERPRAFVGWRADEISRSEIARLNTARAKLMADHASKIEFEAVYERSDIQNTRAWFISDPPDGKIPPFIPSAIQSAAEQRASASPAAAPWQSSGLFGRCITRGIPAAMMPWVYGNIYRIVQAPGLVAISYEMVNETRVIPLDGRPHVGGAIRSYLGDARGRFEGNSLVVETTNFTDKTPFHGSSAHLTLIEHFTPIASNALEWKVTLVDPTVWARPWTLSMTLRQSATGPLEFACHEGNYSMRYSLE